MDDNASLCYIYAYVIDDGRTTKGGPEERQRKAHHMVLRSRKNKPGEQVPGLYNKEKHMTTKTDDTTEWHEVELARSFIDARTCANSILFRIIGTGGDFDGWSFFHPRSLCRFISSGKGSWSISYQDGWEFKLTKRGKNEQGEWVNVGECTLTAEELTEQLWARPLVHKPEYLPPLAHVEVPKELIDE